MIHNPLIYNNIDWVRPADWLPIDHLVDYDSEKVAILVGVYDDEMNKIAFTCRLGTTIDWGDGNITVISAAGNYEHTYDYTNIPDSTLCSRGYKQVILTMYPTSKSYHITRVYCALPTGMYAGSTPRLLDMKLHTPWMNSFRTGAANTQRWAMMEKFVWIGTHDSLTLATINMFYYMIRLQSLYMENPKWNNFYQSSVLLDNVPQLDNYTNLVQQFFHNYKIKEFIHNFTTPTFTSLDSAFAYNFSLEKVEINIPNVTILNTTFLSDYNLREVILHDCGAVTTTTNAFAKTCTGIVKLLLHGLVVSIDCGTMSLSTTALNNLFDSLGTPATTQIITVSINPGASTCDTSIATAKNWTVITV